MKTSLLIISAVLLFSFTACGQSAKDVPANVTSAFTKKFPNASKVKWGKESEKEWEAEFKMDGKEYSANFDLAGLWVETEFEIAATELPAVVKAAVEKESAGLKISEAAVSETKDGKIYEVTAGKGKTAMAFTVDANGVIRKKGLAKEEEEKEEK
jgi:hypothetical protein